MFKYNATSFLGDVYNSLVGFLIAFLTSFIRLIYLNNETSFVKRFSDCVLCGVLAGTSGEVFKAINLSPHLAMPLGAIIGLLGVDYVRSIAMRAANVAVKKGEKSKSE